MFLKPPRPQSPRRGVTLVEMLVTVALLVLMMTILVQIFAAATGAVSAARTYQDLDSGLRQLDSTIRQDLGNVTANFTPPLAPGDNLGYFEYIENSFADSQGEDSDDCLRFTVNAPEGQVFTGRCFMPISATTLASLSAAQKSYFFSVNPITIQSQTAEVIYFLRNGNLYRRVLLVVPDRNSSALAQSATLISGTFGTAVSWLGLNDLSARPSPTGGATIILNSLADLTNRENRFPAPRFTNDYMTSPASGSWTASPDGVPDDQNSDSVPDYWPTLNAHVVSASGATSMTTTNGPGLINEPPNGLGAGGASLTPAQLRSNSTFQTLAFPFIYPYAYSVPDASGFTGLGWIHSPDPGVSFTSAANLFTRLNHSPLDVGDSLAAPSTSLLTPPSVFQTWWGFPTWRETLSPNWVDPFWSVGTNKAQTTGLIPTDPTVALATSNGNFLPPMTTGYVGGTPLRTSEQPFHDGAGSGSPFAAVGGTDLLWKQAWEDDLVMTGVRSFDVKAYDNAYAGYVDLGWGDDLRLYAPYVTSAALAALTPPFLSNNTTSPGGTSSSLSGFPLLLTWPPGSANTFRLIGDTFAHEGRIPPLVNDFRLDPQFVDQTFESQVPVRYKLNELNPQLPTGAGTAFNVGDSNAHVIRLRRVWDSWSTDYTQAPGSAVDPTSGLPWGLAGGRAPIYPSYPPPYRAPLRGIQIQIRVVDPRNERVKVLTIRQDFSDKLGQANP